VAALGVILDFCVSLEAEPLRNRPVLAAGLGELLLDAESLLGLKCPREVCYRIRL